MRVFMPLFAILAIGLTTVSASATTISDGTFNNSDWSLTQFNTSGTANSSATQQTSGGNPGSYRSVTNNVTAPNGFIYSLSLYTAQSYTPAISGAISSVNFSIDYECLSPCFGQGQVFGLAISQGGNFYVDSFSQTNITTGWLNSGTQMIIASDLVQLNATGLVPGSHPNFSTSGSAITFGFVTENFSGGSTYSITAGYDNFEVGNLPTTGATPLPAALPLFATGIGGLGLLGWRRKRKVQAAA
jgi:hypothetical protein